MRGSPPEFFLFLEVLIGGLMSGIMYSLVALGFVLIFKASGIFNFAQGAFVLFAALTFVSLLEAALLGDERRGGSTSSLLPARRRWRRWRSTGSPSSGWCSGRW